MIISNTCPTNLNALVTIEHLVLDSKTQLENFERCKGQNFPALKYLSLSKTMPQFTKTRLPLQANMPILESASINGYDLDKHFPDWLAGAKGLTTLSLTHCNLRYFPEFVLGLDNLESLDLSGNPLVELPDALFKLPKLQHIGFGNHYVQNNPIFGADANANKRFFQQLTQAPHIQSLDLMAYPFLPENWAGGLHLRRLCLRMAHSRQIFTNVEAEATTQEKDTAAFVQTELEKVSQTPVLAPIFAQIAQLSQLRELSLNRLDLPFDYAYAFGQAQNLETLRLNMRNSNHERVEGMDWSVFKSVKHLNIEANFGHMPESLRDLPNLEILELFGCSFAHFQLSNTLPRLHTLRLDFGHSGFKHEVNSASDEFLRVLPQLKTLDISKSAIGAGVKLVKEFYQFIQTAPIDAQQKFFLLLNQEPEELSHADLLACLAAGSSLIALQAWKFLIERFGKMERLTSLDPKKINKYFQIGSPSDPAAFKTLLANQAWKSTKKMEEAGLIILCQTVKTLPNLEGLAWDKLVLETTLAQWLETEQGFERLDTADNQKIIQFLLSNTTENILLGLEMLAKIYSSDKTVDACLMALGMFAEAKEIRDTVKKIIQKNWSPDLLQLFKLHTRKNPGVETYDALKTSELFDQKTFVTCSFGLSVARAGANFYNHFGQLDILKYGGQASAQALETLTRGGRELAFEQAIDYPLHSDFLDLVRKSEKINRFRLNSPTLLLQEQLFSCPKRITSLSVSFSNSANPILSPSTSDLKLLTDLYLSGNNIVFPELMSLENLDSLSLEDPQRRSLPDCFRSFTSLQELKLETPAILALPDWLSWLEGIKDLDMKLGKSLPIDALLNFRKLRRFRLQIPDFTISDKKLPTSICYPNLEHLTTFMQAPTLEKAQENLEHFLSFSGDLLKTFFFADPALTSVCLKTTHSKPNLTNLTFHSEHLETLEVAWAAFPNLKTVGIHRKLSQAQISHLRKQIPNHISLESF